MKKKKANKIPHFWIDQKVGDKIILKPFPKGLKGRNLWDDLILKSKIKEKKLKQNIW